MSKHKRQRSVIASGTITTDSGVSDEPLPDASEDEADSFVWSEPDSAVSCHCGVAASTCAWFHSDRRSVCPRAKMEGIRQEAFPRVAYSQAAAVAAWRRLLETYSASEGKSILRAYFLLPLLRQDKGVYQLHTKEEWGELVYPLFYYCLLQRGCAGELPAPSLLTKEEAETAFLTPYIPREVQPEDDWLHFIAPLRDGATLRTVVDATAQVATGEAASVNWSRVQEVVYGVVHPDLAFALHATAAKVVCQQVKYLELPASFASLTAHPWYVRALPYGRASYRTDQQEYDGVTDTVALWPEHPSRADLTDYLSMYLVPSEPLVHTVMPLPWRVGFLVGYLSGLWVAQRDDALYGMSVIATLVAPLLTSVPAPAVPVGKKRKLLAAPAPSSPTAAAPSSATPRSGRLARRYRM